MAGLSSPLAASSSSASCLSSSASLQGSTLLPKPFSPKFDNSCNKCRSLEIFAQKKVQKRRQVVLSQDVPLLGKTGQLVKVKPGYYRNYLFPYGKAKIATPEYLKEIRLEEERKEAEKRRIKQEAESDALMFKTIGGFSCRRKVGKGKQIFGQVTTQDLADIIKAQTSKVIDKRDITLPEVRELGEYIAEIKLHPEVTAQVRLNVIPN